MENLKKEIEHLETAIRDIAPKMRDAMALYHTLRNKHSQLVSMHRDRQKELLIMQNKVNKIPPHTSEKKSLNNGTKKKAIDTSKLTPAQIIELRKFLLGE